jgi:hypothetical protein
MGRPITDPKLIEYGLDCPTCTPSDFDPGKTPAIIKVVFHEITKCGPLGPAPPNGRIFNCFQQTWAACYWWSKWFLTDWWVRLMLGPTYSQLVCYYGDYDFRCFLHDQPETCRHVYVNQLICPPDLYTDGVGWAMSPAFKHERDADHIPYVLAVDYGLTNLSTVLYDSLPCGIDHQVVKLVRKSDKTNVLIYCDNQEFPP